MAVLLSLKTNFDENENIDFKDIEYLLTRGNNITYNPFVSSIVSACIGKNNNVIEVMYYVASSEKDKIKKEEEVINVADMEEYTVKYIPVYAQKLKDAEKTIVENIVKYLENNLDNEELVTFNGKTYDLEVLKTKVILYDINISENLQNLFFSPSVAKTKHIDLIETFNEKYKLNFLVEKIANVKYQRQNRITENFRNGEYKEIAEYNVYDMIAMSILHKKLSKYLNLKQENQLSENQKNYFYELLEKYKRNTLAKEDIVSKMETIPKSVVSQMIDFLKKIDAENQTRLAQEREQQRREIIRRATITRHQ